MLTNDDIAKLLAEISPSINEQTVKNLPGFEEVAGILKWECEQLSPIITVDSARQFISGSTKFKRYVLNRLIGKNQ